MEKISELRVDITSSNVVYLNFLVESGNLHDGYKGSHENDDQQIFDLLSFPNSCIAVTTFDMLKQMFP